MVKYTAVANEAGAAAGMTDNDGNRGGGRVLGVWHMKKNYILTDDDRISYDLAIEQWERLRCEGLRNISDPKRGS